MINLRPSALIAGIQGMLPDMGDLLGHSQDKEHRPPQPPTGDGSGDSATAWAPQFGEPIQWKVLSIRQPFAHLIVVGEKDVENRTWETPYRGPILIHAGKSMFEGHKTLVKAMRDEGMAVPEKFDRGGIVGVATLVDIVTRKRSRRDYWFEGPCGWILENPRPLPFMPLKGQLQLFSIQYPAILNY